MVVKTLCVCVCVCVCIYVQEAESQEDSLDDDLVLTRKKVNIRCPITQKIMQRPMKNKRCGHCYDRQGIEDLINHRGNKAR